MLVTLRTSKSSSFKIACSDRKNVFVADILPRFSYKTYMNCVDISFNNIINKYFVSECSYVV
jgi:hypothetical protein